MGFWRTKKPHTLRSDSSEPESTDDIQWLHEYRSPSRFPSALDLKGKDDTRRDSSSIKLPGVKLQDNDQVKQLFINPATAKPQVPTLPQHILDPSRHNPSLLLTVQRPPASSQSNSSITVSTFRTLSNPFSEVSTALAIDVTDPLYHVRLEEGREGLNPNMSSNDLSLSSVSEREPFAASRRSSTPDTATAHGTGERLAKRSKRLIPPTSLAALPPLGTMDLEAKLSISTSLLFDTIEHSLQRETCSLAKHVVVSGHEQCRCALPPPLLNDGTPLNKDDSMDWLVFLEYLTLVGPLLIDINRWHRKFGASRTAMFVEQAMTRAARIVEAAESISRSFDEAYSFVQDYWDSTAFQRSTRQLRHIADEMGRGKDGMSNCNFRRMEQLL